MVWNKFVEVTRVLETQRDEYVFEYWNQLRRDLMYVKSMMSVEQRRLDSQLGEHLDQSDCPIFLMLARSFWHRKFT
jgi:hypothetical protein